MNQNHFVEMGLLCEEIKGLRHEIQAMREMLQQDLHKRQSVNVEKTEVEPIEKGDLDSQVSSMIQCYQIPVHIKGFKYIKEAVKMELESRALAMGITKIVYPTIAKKYDDSATRVERAIRHAIESSWYKSNHDDFSKMMEKPTNAHFIALLAEKIRVRNIEYSA